MKAPVHTFEHADLEDLHRTIEGKAGRSMLQGLLLTPSQPGRCLEVVHPVSMGARHRKALQRFND